MITSYLRMSVNVNVGVVGHVDSGKTTLAKALSVVGSTASFDKHPQSQERGITLDLGFSSFTVEIPEDHQLFCKNYSSGDPPIRHLQYTLVDCPGHASLLRTVIGGSSIIDLFILVIDVIAGIQTQTAECIVVADITRPSKLIVALNKVDLIQETEREAKVEKMRQRVTKALSVTSFKDCPIIPISAQSGIGLEDFKATLLNATSISQRSNLGPFVLSADHCFSLKGQGTVLTGTVLSGGIKVGESVEIPHVKESRKVKSIQVFRKPVQSAVQGDRIGLCVSQLDASDIERCLVCSPGALLSLNGGIFTFDHIAYFKSPIKNKSKFHISIGHETAMGKCTFFTVQRQNDGLSLEQITFVSDYEWFDVVPSNCGENKVIMVLVELASPVLAMPKALMIGSRLDSDVNAKTCRLAFHGELAVPVLSEASAKLASGSAVSCERVLERLRVYKNKERSGNVERRHDDVTLIVVGLFKKETNLDLFKNMKVELSTGEQGVIEGGFGSSGKIRVRILSDFKEETVEILDLLSAKKKKQAGPSDTAKVELKVFLRFRKYIFAKDNLMVQ